MKEEELRRFAGKAQVTLPVVGSPQCPHLTQSTGVRPWSRSQNLVLDTPPFASATDSQSGAECVMRTACLAGMRMNCTRAVVKEGNHGKDNSC